MQPSHRGLLVTDGHLNRVLRVRLDGEISEFARSQRVRPQPRVPVIEDSQIVGGIVRCALEQEGCFGTAAFDKPILTPQAGLLLLQNGASGLAAAEASDSLEGPSPAAQVRRRLPVPRRFQARALASRPGVIGFFKPSPSPRPAGGRRFSRAPPASYVPVLLACNPEPFPASSDEMPDATQL
jgi:hypothetical protein